MTPEEQLLSRVEYLEAVLLDLMDIFIDNKHMNTEFAEHAGGDAQELKENF